MGDGKEQILIAANELQVLEMARQHEDFHLGTSVADVCHEPEEEHVSLAVVYGAFQVNPDRDIDDECQELLQQRGCGFGFLRDLECNVFCLVDIELHKDRMLPHYRNIPFAALVALPDCMVVGDSKTQALTGFVRYSDQMDPLTNIFYRPGLLAMKSQEKRIREELTKDNWKQFIDLERMEVDAGKAL